MKKICSFFSCILKLLLKNNLNPVNNLKVGFNIEGPFEGLEYQAIHKNNLQETEDFQF